MPASVADQGALPQEVMIYEELKTPEIDQLAAGRCQPVSGKVMETGKKRTLDVMQSDGHIAARKTVEDTPDRTSSEDEQQRRDNPGAVHVDAGLPPMAPTKVPPKSAMAAKEDANKNQSERYRAANVVEVVGGDRLPRPPAATKKTKLGKAKTSKKAATKSDQERRRKRKERNSRSSAGISQASAEMLFQCSCQLLRTQALEYDVRAREMEERNSTQAKEIEEWEKRIRSLKRELEEYADELPSSEMADTALIEAHPAAQRASGEQANPLSAMANAVNFGAAAAVESSLPLLSLPPKPSSKKSCGSGQRR
ncbi:hypothetical protein AM588_10002518 [Phytophthora nicotianae]|uniref:Uncharacterized protein n=1 Tax=Phytophthora nicotianae TaxID=4792 RepID=A0A0W8CQ60_PHYNI|nr:hypothetical protein AM588_10002518 [Phytophthora nicotianae]